MRLSPFHLELAKRVAQGQPNREIMKHIKISGSRLSVLKANPLFSQQVSKFALMEEEKYKKALDIFGINAEKVAENMVDLATGPLTPHSVKLNAGEAILERLAQAEGQIQGSGEQDEIMFEQVLRVTKKGMGLAPGQKQGIDSGGIDSDAAMKELAGDLAEVEHLKEAGQSSFA